MNNQPAVAIELIRDNEGTLMSALPIPINRDMKILPTTNSAYPWVQVVKGKPVVLFRSNEIRVFNKRFVEIKP